MKYTISDGNGGTVDKTLDVSIIRPNASAPTAVADFGTTTEDTVLTVKDGTAATTLTVPDGKGGTMSITGNADLLLNDTDPDAGDGPATFRISQVNGLANNVDVAIDGSKGGTFTIDQDGSWTFDPDGDFDKLKKGETRDTSVEYTTFDGRLPDGTNDTATAIATTTLTVTVTGENDPSKAMDDYGEVKADVDSLFVNFDNTGTTSGTTIVNAGLLENDESPDREPGIRIIRIFEPDDTDPNKDKQSRPVPNLISSAD